MAKQIDPIKKERYKRARLEGKSIAKSLLSAGYSKTSAYNRNSQLSCVKVGEAEIKESVEERITVDYVLKGLDKEARKAKKSADRIQAYKLLGQFRAMFTEKRIIETHYIEPTEREQKLSRLRTLIIRLLPKETEKPIPPIVVDTKIKEY